MLSKTILATCYAVNPYKGSEDGMGWNFIIQIARFNKVFAVTRQNNKESIERYMLENPNEVYANMKFLYFDLPYWMRFWKKGGRGAMLYCYMWQKGIVPFIRKHDLKIDIVHNVNFHSDWMPSFLWKLNKPMVWGPIGHHPLIPNQYLKHYSFKYYLKDRGTWLMKKIFWSYSTSLKQTIKNSNHILCMNTSVAAVLKLNKQQYSILPSVATEPNEIIKKGNNKDFHVISVGRFVPLKGFDLTLGSFIQLLESISIHDRKKCKLTLVGTGPEKEMYQKIIAENNVQDYVQIIEWMERKELMQLYQQSSVFLFPSHEGAGMVVAEALSFGLPIVCLNNEGPGEFINDCCGFAIPKLDYDNTILELSKALQQLFLDSTLLHSMSIEARKHYETKFTWASRGEYLNTIYQQL
jgi:glycosyltransferase involved in cell wall biosynthesis